MMLANSTKAKRRAASEGSSRRHLKFDKRPQLFSQEFDLRPMIHSAGARPADALGRSCALRPPPSPAKAARREPQEEVGADSSWARAADNAADLEWASARDELNKLAQHSMTAAETGVRLQALFRRVPSLLADELGELLSSDVEGGEGKKGIKRELLSLPLPKCKLVRETELAALFHSNKVLGPKAQELGAKAWQHLLAAAWQLRLLLRPANGGPGTGPQQPVG